MFLSGTTVRFWLTFVLVAAGCGLSCQAGVPDSVQSKALGKLSGKAQNSGLSGPAVGVALLEHIFSRFSNVPQIAMNQANSLNQFTPTKKNVAPNSVDYALAIRPKDSSKGWVAPSPSLQIIAQRAPVSGRINSEVLMAQSRLAGSFSDRAGAGAGAGAGPAPAPVSGSDEGAPMAPRQQQAYGEPETWKGNMLARGQSTAAELRQLSKAENDQLGFWEKDKEASAKPQESAESNVKAKLQNRFEKLAQAKEESSMPALRRKRDMPEAKTALDSRSVVADSDLLEDQKASLGKRHDVIALLPPNVVSGIPLVSLGASKAQVIAAFAGLGEISDEKINGWNVLSLYRKGGDKKIPSLQLFFRHGLLDAIRIFDKSLIAPDFGVSPGDGLAAVKQKFGEPAFLVQEPQPGSGQNYIYPISQAGFQLARTNPSGIPIVMSVLIFSVK